MSEETRHGPAAEVVRAVGAFLRDLVNDPSTEARFISDLDSAAAVSVALEVRPGLQITVQGRGPAGEFGHVFPLTVIPPPGGLN